MKKIFIYSLMFFLNTTCGKSVKRLTHKDEINDLSGDFAYNDYKEFADFILKELAKSTWIDDYRAENEKIPIILVDEIIPKVTSNQINSEDLTSEVEMALMEHFSAGKRIKIVSGGAVRNRIRRERMTQQMHASAETKSRLGREAGANVIMNVTITEINDFRDSSFLTKKQEYRIYNIYLEANDIETSQLLWKKKVVMKKHIKG